MRQYLDLIRLVLDTGSWQENRTGIRTLSIPGAMMRFDLRQGFPAVTTKKLAFKSVVGELVGFLRGATSAANFRALGCNVWDQNANENAQWLSNPYRSGVDDLGPVYGAQWRRWPAFKKIGPAPASRDGQEVANALEQGYRLLAKNEHCDHILYREIDQLRACLDMIMKDPGSRRILFHAWNPAQLDQMALPPCHLLYQFLVNQSTREINMCLYIRSNDLGLGAPFNIAEAAALLTLVGRLTGYTPAWLTYMVADAHIYENHLDMLGEQLTREPLPLPRLHISDGVPDYAHMGEYAPRWLDMIRPEDFTLEGYAHHPPLTAPMAV